MSSTSTFLPVPQEDISSFWTDQERRFPDGGNQVQTQVLAPVALKSQTPPLHSRSLSRENKLHACPEPRDSKNDSEEGISYVSVSMAASADEKMLLLNKAMELRRLNKELMKLNQEWDHTYRKTTLQMQQKVNTLKVEVVSLKQQLERLTVKLEYEQNKKEYYEQALLQEFKKNQQLQEYVKYLERKVQQNRERPNLVNYFEGYGSSPVLMTRRSLKDSAQYRYGRGNTKGQKTTYCKHQLAMPNLEKEMTDLMDELRASKCQTETLAADPPTEHKVPQPIKVERENFYKKEEEMRQQMALLQEQLKIFEDNFRKEQILSKSHGKSATPGACECNSKEKLSVSFLATSVRPKPGGCSNPSTEVTKYSKKESEAHVPPLY
ncbi:uncharacterized protein [Notamacropus eugenii]|uniref:uncharacterized protein n=1 Tax=Notamacropus eugenii TaxID=9315 RepID=UPI003B67F527